MSLWWDCRCDFWKNCLGQSMQAWRRSPLCVRECLFRFPTFENHLSHTSHWAGDGGGRLATRPCLANRQTSSGGLTTCRGPRPWARRCRSRFQVFTNHLPQISQPAGVSRARALPDCAVSTRRVLQIGKSFKQPKQHPHFHNMTRNVITSKPVHHRFYYFCLVCHFLSDAVILRSSSQASGTTPFAAMSSRLSAMMTDWCIWVTTASNSSGNSVL